MLNNIFKGAYINEDEKKSYPIGTPSQGYDASGKKIVQPTSTYQALFSGSTQGETTAKKTTDSTGVPLNFISPDTNDFYTPTEYAGKIKETLPKETYTIPKYAGDQLTEGAKTTERLAAEAGSLAAEKGDIASGTTDPYKVASKSGVAYSPEELSAIENAYAGIYTPALDTAIAKMKAQKDKEDQIFQTNENIRQWKATTGTKQTSDEEESQFTKTQENTGASNAGVSISTFKDMDEDLKNFYVNNPMSNQTNDNNKSLSVNDSILQAIQNVKDGTERSADVADEINDSNLAPSVKQYFISQLPLTDVEKEGYWSKIWKAITNQ